MKILRKKYMCLCSITLLMFYRLEALSIQGVERRLCTYILNNIRFEKISGLIWTKSAFLLFWWIFRGTLCFSREKKMILWRFKIHKHTSSQYPNISTTALRQWGFWQCLLFSWTTLRCEHCQHPIVVMGVVDTFGQND